jgi:hypothetical protein
MREPDVELTAEERGLFDQIEFDQGRVTHETCQANAALVERLYDLLTARDALPAHRLRWFTAPEFNPGRHGKSRQEQWWRNGTCGGEIIVHPNFLDDFAYFICGPDLPPAAVRAFRAAVKNCGMVSSGDIPILRKTARTLARQHGLKVHDADEFYKLAVDCGLGRRAEFIRDGVRSLR